MVMERLDAAARHDKNQDSIKQFAIREAKRLLRDAKVKDPGPKETVAKKAVKTQPAKETPKSPLEIALLEYDIQPFTPELITRTHQAIWQVRGEVVRETYEVAPCTYTQEKLDELEKQSRRVGYLPPELSTQVDRPTSLGKYRLRWEVTVSKKVTL